MSRFKGAGVSYRMKAGRVIQVWEAQMAPNQKAAPMAPTKTMQAMEPLALLARGRSSVRGHVGSCAMLPP